MSSAHSDGDRPATEAADAGGGFRCVIAPSTEESAWVSAVGPLGAAPAGAFAAVLEEAVERFVLVVLDLRSVTELDTPGVHVIIAAGQYARHRACRLVVLAPEPFHAVLQPRAAGIHLLELTDDPGPFLDPHSPPPALAPPPATDRVALGPGHIDLEERAAWRRDQAALSRDRIAEDRETEIAGLALAGTASHRVVAELIGAARTARADASADRLAARTDRRRAARQRVDAGTDELTGLLRRGIGETAITREIGRARRAGTPLVLVMIDIDELKHVNDTYGHAAGDSLIRDVGHALSASTRFYDLAVRWGGDEFLCALPGASLELAAARLGEVRRRVRKAKPDGSISAGLAVLDPGDDFGALLSRADDALYADKRGR